MTSHRLEAALRGILAQAESSSEFRENFAKERKETFTDLFIKLSVHARARKEPQVRDLLEQCWRAIFPPALPMPTVPPPELKPLVIFPGTSISDAIKLLEENAVDKRNTQVALKYLEKELANKASESQFTSKTLKACIDTLEKIQGGGGALGLQIKEACAMRLVDISAKEKTKKMEEERRRLKLEASKNPAAKRALDKMNATSAAAAAAASAASGPLPPPAAVAKATSALPKKLTDEEWEREYLKRARLANEMREMEEAHSRKIGREEDAKAAKESKAL